jgi:hypothetical protein
LTSGSNTGLSIVAFGFALRLAAINHRAIVRTENLIRVDEAMESPKLAE